MQIKLTVWCSILPTGLAKTYKHMGKHTLLHFWLDHDLLQICGVNHLPLSFTTRKIHTLRPCISFWGIYSIGIKLLVHMHEHGFSLLWYSGKTNKVKEQYESLETTWKFINKEMLLVANPILWNILHLFQGRSIPYYVMRADMFQCYIPCS